MKDTFLGSGRVFASHYQIVICDDPMKITDDDDDNWTEETHARGFAGSPDFRMINTAAHLNDHWVELFLSVTPPDLKEWQRITCVDLQNRTGEVHVMGLFDDPPPISAKVDPATMRHTSPHKILGSTG